MIALTLRDFYQEPSAFSGSGQMLTGRSGSAQVKGREKDQQSTNNSLESWRGTGQNLGTTSGPRELGPVGAGGARIPRIPQRTQKQKQAKKERSPSPDWGVEDDDVDMIDSD